MAEGGEGVSTVRPKETDEFTGTRQALYSSRNDTSQCNYSRSPPCSHPVIMNWSPHLILLPPGVCVCVWGGGGGPPIYKPYRYVPPKRVPFSSISSLK